MEDLDSLLADLERATTNLKRNPQKPGGWKLNNGPGDVTINSEPTYSTAKVAKHYSPQYYVPEEPYYQNGSSSLKRSTSSGSAYHDYAKINGAGDSFDSGRESPSRMHSYGKHSNNVRTVINAKPRNHDTPNTVTHYHHHHHPHDDHGDCDVHYDHYHHPTTTTRHSTSLPRNHRSAGTTIVSRAVPDPSHYNSAPKRTSSIHKNNEADLREDISQKLTMLDDLLDDLNSMPNQRKVEHFATMPNSNVQQRQRSLSPMNKSQAQYSARSPSPTQQYNPRQRSLSPDSIPTYATLSKVPHKSVTVITKGPSTYIHSKGPARSGHQQNGNVSYATINGTPTVQSRPAERADEAQVNELIKDLEFSLQTNGHSNHIYTHPHRHQNGNATLPQHKTKSVTFEDGGTPAKMTQVDHAQYQPVSYVQHKQVPIYTNAPNTNKQEQARSPSPSRPRTPIEPEEEYHRNLVNLQPQKIKMNSNPIIEIPVGSHATRELDDLMASLSDFKMNQIKQNGQDKKTNYINLGQVQVPKKGHGERSMLYKPANPNVDLESMIGDIEKDINRHGLNVGPKGDCGACGRPIVGQVVAALGKMFHPEHFRCAKCNTELGDKAFFERDEVAYCQDDYHRLFSPKCNYCNKPILDRCITALDKTWHPEHFFCAHCGKNFGDDGYHEKNGAAYCRDDFFKLFAPKCMGCYESIVDNFVEAMGGHWHQECFVCRDCNEPFHGGNFFDFEGNPYCEPHFHNKKGNLCATCRNPITGRCITAMSQKYHPEHFTCSFCLKQLNKGTFKKHHEKPYCHSCFEKLFA